MSMTIPTTATLAELIDRNPALARELERRDLDYCCGGRRSLADACAERGLDAERVAAELAATAPEPPEPWTGYSPTELVDHLVATHHRYLHDEMPRLSALMDKVLAAHSGRHPELAEIRDCYQALRADLEPHLAKEEQILFPLIRDLTAPASGHGMSPVRLAMPMAVMRHEHDHAGELLADLRRLTGGFTPPADGCASFRALYAGLAELEVDTHLHVHKENNVLFPAVERMGG
jgi:regulator of cell morphogenesis and NO signaling